MQCTRRCQQGQCVEKGECRCSTPVWQICGTNTCKYCQNLEECTDEGLKKSWDFRWIVESNLKATWHDTPIPFCHLNFGQFCLWKRVTNGKIGKKELEFVPFGWDGQCLSMTHTNQTFRNIKDCDGSDSRGKGWSDSSYENHDWKRTRNGYVVEMLLRICKLRAEKLRVNSCKEDTTTGTCGKLYWARN